MFRITIFLMLSVIFIVYECQWLIGHFFYMQYSWLYGPRPMGWLKARAFGPAHSCQPDPSIISGLGCLPDTSRRPS